MSETFKEYELRLHQSHTHYDELAEITYELHQQLTTMTAERDRLQKHYNELACAIEKKSGITSD